MSDVLDRKNTVVMKLLHYFITEKNYSPIILQGVDDEIWLENLNSDYKVVRIVSNYLHNNEQLDFDLFKTGKIAGKIRRKTLSFKMKVLSLYTDLGDNVDLSETTDCAFIHDDKDIKKYKFIIDSFPDITKKLKFSEEGVQLFVKITSDINEKNREDATKADEIFTPKRPIVTQILILINIFCFVLSYFLGDNFVGLFTAHRYFVVEEHEFYRLMTSGFFHANIIHILFNMYALYVIGSQMESYMGKWRYLVIYFYSIITSSLLAISMYDGHVLGASGAIFGLLGAMLYFGYHYRVYLGTVIKSQIIPIIIINLAIGFMFSDNISNFGHIGGLIGGVAATVAVGVKYKSTKFEMINGIVVALLFLIALGFLLLKAVA